MYPFIRSIARTVIGGEARELSYDLDFTLRADRRGGDLLPNVMSSSAAAKLRQRFVILVHGFNVDRDDAQLSYGNLQENLGIDGSSTRNDFKNFFWPGDPRVIHYPKRLPTDYAKAVNVAKLSGIKLASYIEMREDDDSLPSEVVFVAHSLGCRLVLEALAVLSKRGFRTSSKIDLILMAAAVPTDFVDQSGHLSPAINFVARKVAVYSYNDKVLRKWFPIGQAWSDDKSPDDVEAIGLYGKPNLIWNELKPNNHLDHGDYWKSPSVANIISSHLHLRPATNLPRRDLSSRILSGGR